MQTCGPWDCGPETYASRMPRELDFIEGNNNPCVKFSWARRGLVSGGVFDHSTHEEDGPGTWEALASPRRNPGVAESR
jgi:hypothetical protein